MHKLKKKDKEETQLPKPINIKKEKTDEERQLHGLSHYVGDRLELCKQIFSTLKPKTIVNLAPDFLKAKEMEEIQEMCLNELLGISTKRLMSIINATKCPTDTESDTDSDVEHKEDHVSLEEISSDSEIEGGKSKNRKKVNGSKSKRNEAATGAGKRELKDSTENNEESGQISVLELLELQARARAIRSQLALEPVTKIELDDKTDETSNKDDTSKKSSSSTSHKERKHSRKRKTSEKERSRDNSESASTSKQSKPHHDSNTEEATVSSTSNSNVETGNLNGNAEENTENDKASGKKIKIKRSFRKSSLDKQFEDSKSQQQTEVKQERSSRSASPDVIPIVSEPVTLMISDSSDEENKNHNLGANMQQEGKEVSEKKELSADNNENAKDTEIKNNNIEIKDTIDNASQKEQNNEPIKLHSEEASQVEDNSNRPDNSANLNEDDENEHDDVISLEGGDLESEMIEHLEEETKSSQSSDKQRQNPKDKEIEEDVISLSEEEEGNESWHSRYLKSSKVSKVLAESRLGKRVRDKIKKSKRSSRRDSTSDKEIDKSKSSSFSSKHEDGSVEQYKELLEHRQRKS